MARGNGTYSTLFFVFLLIISNAESRSNPTATKTTLACNQVYGAQLGDTCSAVVQNFALSAESFSGLNPNLNCDKIFVGQWLCVDGEFST